MIPKIRVVINPDMSNYEYIAWNVAGCVRTLKNSPFEYSITLKVYELHKEILRNRGASEEELAVGDKFVEDAKTKYLSFLN